MLTQRQRDVLALVAQGMPNKAIASALGMQLSTVKAHVARGARRLGATNRTQAALAFLRGAHEADRRLLDGVER